MEQGHGIVALLHPLLYVAGSCCRSGVLARLRQLCPILRAPVRLRLFLRGGTLLRFPYEPYLSDVKP